MSITPQDFIKRWGTEEEPLVKVPPQSVRALTIPEDARQFLAKAGLPASAAPFLSFDAVAEGLRPVKDRIRGFKGAAAEYLIIGGDGGGNPIVLDDKGEVRLVDPDAPGGLTFMNSSVAHLAACLLAARAIYDVDDLPRRTLAEMYAKNITQADARAMEPGGYWWSETRMFADDAD
jgi:hypothetical protein